MSELEQVFSERIRRVWHNDDWWFSVIDVVGALTDSPRPSKYWNDMRRRLQDVEGFTELSAKCGKLKMRSTDGKMRTTDVADTETLLRIVQSIPSPRAEPFKRWLAQVGTERLQEAAQPGKAEERLIAAYRKKGYSDDWIHQRIQNIIYRDDVTGEWSKRGAGASRQIAALTDVLNKDSFGVTTAEHKQYKGLRSSDNLRDSETVLELAITGLAEATAATLHRQRDTQGFDPLRDDCHDAGDAAKRARQEIEKTTGGPVLSQTNYKELQKEQQKELQPGLFPEED